MSTGASQIICLSFEIALSCVSSQHHSVFLCSSCLSGSVTLDKLGRNLERYCTMPRNSCNALTLVGVGMLTIAAVFSGSGASPLSVSRCPIKGTDEHLNFTLVGFNFKPFSLALLRNALKLRSWLASASSVVLPIPQTKKSSAITSTLCKPSTIWFIRCCHTSGALLIPNGILSQRYLPNGVLKVVR